MRSGALLLGLGLWLSAREALGQQQPFTWDVPRVVEAVEVPGVMNVEGIPVRLRSVKSTEKPEALLKHLVDRFEAWGLYIPPPPHRTRYLREPHLTALDPARLVSYTVLLQANGDGTTTVVMGEAFLGQAGPRQAPLAPLFPGAVEVMSSHLEVARWLSYRVPGGKGHEVEAFYRAEWVRAGYSEVEPNLYLKGSEQLELVVQPGPPGHLAVQVMGRRVARP